MNRINTLLLAVIAAVLVVGLGYWIATDRAQARAADEAARAAQARRSEAIERDCWEMVSAWDRGERDAIRERFGSLAQGQVDGCRPLAEAFAN